MVVDLKEQKNGLTAFNRRQFEGYLMAVYMANWEKIDQKTRTAATDAVYLALPDRGKRLVLEELSRLRSAQEE